MQIIFFFFVARRLYLKWHHCRKPNFSGFSTCVIQTQNAKFKKKARAWFYFENAMDEPVGLPLLRLCLQIGLCHFSWWTLTFDSLPAFTWGRAEPARLFFPPATKAWSNIRGTLRSCCSVVEGTSSESRQAAEHHEMFSYNKKRLKCFQVLLWIHWKIESLFYFLSFFTFL